MDHREGTENSAELLKAQYGKEAGLGQGIVRNADFRRKHGLTPFVNSAKFPREDLLGAKPLKEGEAVTQEQVEAAKRASLSIAFESALQVLEYRPQSTQVRDDPESLNHLKKSLQEGFTRFEQMGKAGKLEDLRGIAVAAFERRSKDSKGLANLEATKFSAWLGEIFRDAHSKIAQKEKSIDDYKKIRPSTHQ